MTFQDLRSGCDYYALPRLSARFPREKGHKLLGQPSSRQLPLPSSFDGTSHLHCSLRPVPRKLKASAFASTLASGTDAVKASVPKLFGCPGARGSHRFLNLQHRRIAPSSVLGSAGSVSSSCSLRPYSTGGIAPNFALQTLRLRRRSRSCAVQNHTTTSPQLTTATNPTQSQTPLQRLTHARNRPTDANGIRTGAAS